MTAGTLTVLREQSEQGHICLAAAGSWTAENAGILESLVNAATRPNSAMQSVAIDAAKIERLDSFGAWLLERALRAWGDQKCDAKLIGLNENYRGLFNKVHVGTQTLSPEPVKRNSIVATLDSVGRTMVAVFDDLVLLAQMVGSVIAALGRVIMHPSRFRFTSMINHLERVGWHAVPIIVLITVLIGAILAQQGIFHFRKFGADIYVVDMVGVLVLRELGVLIVCIMIAGRSGSPTPPNSAR